jgi:hypothetical protein
MALDKLVTYKDGQATFTSNLSEKERLELVKRLNLPEQDILTFAPKDGIDARSAQNWVSMFYNPCNSPKIREELLKLGYLTLSNQETKPRPARILSERLERPLLSEINLNFSNPALSSAVTYIIGIATYFKTRLGLL